MGRPFHCTHATIISQKLKYIRVLRVYMGSGLRFKKLSALLLRMTIANLGALPHLVGSDIQLGAIHSIVRSYMLLSSLYTYIQLHASLYEQCDNCMVRSMTPALRHSNVLD